MFFKVACLYCVALVFLVDSAPSSDKEEATVIPIVAQTDELEPNGTYKFSYETGNGIKREETSYDKTLSSAEGRSAKDKSKEDNDDDENSDEIHVQQGSWSYIAPDGTEIKVSYIADENGFQPVGKHLPRVPAVTGESDKEEKSGRSLKSEDQSESASAPVALSRSEKPDESEDKKDEDKDEKNSDKKEENNDNKEKEDKEENNDSTPSESSTTENTPSSNEASTTEASTESEKTTKSKEDSSTTTDYSTTTDSSTSTASETSTPAASTTTDITSTTTGAA